MKTKKDVIRAIGCEFLELCKADGYHYFVYDDVMRDIYETHSEYVMHFNSMSFERWVEIGKAFVQEVKEKQIENSVW